MDHFGWTPAQIGELTDLQIDDYCFHAREEDGGVRRPRRPEAEKSEAERVASFLALARSMGASEEDVAAKVAEIRAHCAAQERGEAPTAPSSRELYERSLKKRPFAARQATPGRHCEPPNPPPANPPRKE